MAEFPATKKASGGGYTLIPRWKTIIAAMDSGVEQRRQKWTFPKYDIKLSFAVLSASEIQAIWNFFVARHGSFEAFYFYTYDALAWTGCYIGVGDGATQTFDIPGKGTSAQTIYVDGASTVAVTILTGGGAESSDRVTFTIAPAAGAILSCDFTGYMRIRCRFKEDTIDRSHLQHTLYTTGIELKGLHG